MNQYKLLIEKNQFLIFSNNIKSTVYLCLQQCIKLNNYNTYDIIHLH